MWDVLHCTVACAATFMLVALAHAPLICGYRPLLLTPSV
jgi:hypothetical protein